MGFISDYNFYEEKDHVQDMHTIVATSRFSKALLLLDDLVSSRGGSREVRALISEAEIDLDRITQLIVKDNSDIDAPTEYCNIKNKLHDITELVRSAFVHEHDSKFERDLVKGLKNNSKFNRELDQYLNELKIAKEPDAEQNLNNRLTDLCNTCINFWFNDKNAQRIFSELINADSVPDRSRAMVLSALCRNAMVRHNYHITQQVIASLCNMVRKNSFPELTFPRLVVTLVADMLSHPIRWQQNTFLMDEFKNLLHECEVAHDVDKNNDLLYHIKMCIGIFCQSLLVGKIEDFLTKDMSRFVSKMVSVVQKHIAQQPNSNTVVVEDPAEIFGSMHTMDDFIGRLTNWVETGADCAVVKRGRTPKMARFEKILFNWLRPFTAEDEWIAPLYNKFDHDKLNAIVKALCEDKKLCDSDKFILLLRLESDADLDRLGTTIRTQEFSGTLTQKLSGISMMLGVTPEEPDAPKHSSNEEPYKVANQPASIIKMRHFVQDLYRAARICAESFGPALAFTDPLEVIDNEPFNVVFDNDAELDELGSFFFKEGLTQQALNLYEHLVKRSKRTNVKYLCKLALCQFNMLQFADSVENLKQAELIDDNDPWIKNMLARCQMNLNNFQSVLYNLEMLERKRPLNRKQNLWRARSHFQLGNFEQAAAILKPMTEGNITDGDHPDWEAIVNYAQVLQAMGQSEQAAQLALKVDDDGGISQYTAIALSEVLFATGCHIEACNITHRLIEEVGADDLRRVIYHEAQTLKFLNVSPETLYLAIDAIEYQVHLSDEAEEGKYHDELDHMTRTAFGSGSDDDGDFYDDPDDLADPEDTDEPDEDEDMPIRKSKRGKK